MDMEDIKVQFVPLNMLYYSLFFIWGLAYDSVAL